MAVYAHAVTSDLAKVARLGDPVGVAIFVGKVDITNYNATTKPTITDISGKFKKVIGVSFDVSDLGFQFTWDNANNTIKAWYGDYNNAADGPLIEAVTDTDVGAANFIAIGLI